MNHKLSKNDKSCADNPPFPPVPPCAGAWTGFRVASPIKLETGVDVNDRGGVGLGESPPRTPLTAPMPTAVVVLELLEEGSEGSSSASKSFPRLVDPPGGGGGIKKGNPFELFDDEALGGGSSCGGKGLEGAGHLLPLEADAPESKLSVLEWSNDTECGRE